MTCCFDGLGRDRAEGAEADMEREVGEAHAAGGEAGEQFGREMQAGGGRGHRNLVRAIGIDRLVALEVEAALVRRVRGGCRAAAAPRRGGWRPRRWIRRRAW